MEFKSVSPRVILHVSLLLILLYGGVLGAGEWRSRRCADNELWAMRALKVLATAEADFRANDRDANRLNDFWTGDVAGLHHLAVQGIPIRLIPRDLADADAAPRLGKAEVPVPYHGYYFISLDWDESVEPTERYGVDTDWKSGRTKNLQRFGFCAYPAEPGVSGRMIYIVNENLSLRSRFSGETAPPKSWPSDQKLKQFWGRGGC